MEDMPPPKRARQERNLQARMKWSSTDNWIESLQQILSLARKVKRHHKEFLRREEFRFQEEFRRLQRSGLLDTDIDFFSDGEIYHNSFPLVTQSNLEPQTQPQLQYLQYCHQQILLLAATDVFETLVLRLNHYLEEWKEARGHRFDSSIPPSYSDMVYLLLKPQLPPQFKKAMDDVESAFLRDLRKRGCEYAIECKGRLRQELTAFITKAKRESGRNEVAHPFSTSIKQFCKSSSGASPRVRCLLDTAVDDLIQSEKDSKLRTLDLLSDSRNLPKRYRDLAQVAFPLQIFFLRDVLKKSKVKVEIAGGQ